MPQLITLTQEEYQNILTAERNLSMIFTEFDKLESCGVLCDQLRSHAQQQLDVIQKIKAAYRPE